ncbi:hypothetical protein JCM10212_000110 [Sporobolomyces blumeae]
MAFFSFRSLIKWFAATVAVSIGGVGLGLYLAQTKLIYPSNMPAGSRAQVPTPDEFGMPSYDEVTLVTPDGVRIKAFVILYDRDGCRPHERPTVLMLHANAGNVGHRLPLAKVFYERMRCNVVALSYRGYGRSEGIADEKGIKLDAQTALDYILSHVELEKTKVWVYGQSIGGAVSIFLASQNANRVHGLVIENTFLSLPKLVPHVMPFLAPFVPYLLHQIWPSERYIATLPPTFPVLFLAGARDELVEPGQMKGLWRLCSSEAKEWREYPNGTHNDTCIQPNYFNDIALFIARHSNLPIMTEPSSHLPSPRAPPSLDPSSTTANHRERPSISTTLDDVRGPTETCPIESSSLTSPSKASDSSDSSAESFELITASREGSPDEKGKEEEDEEAGRIDEQTRAGIVPGLSLGPKEELELIEREVKDKVKNVSNKL